MYLSNLKRWTKSPSSYFVSRSTQNVLWRWIINLVSRVKAKQRGEEVLLSICQDETREFSHFNETIGQFDKILQLVSVIYLLQKNLVLLPYKEALEFRSIFLWSVSIHQISIITSLFTCLIFWNVIKKFRKKIEVGKKWWRRR